MKHTFIALVLLLCTFGCNQLPKAVTATSKAVTGMRQGITLEMDARCKATAVQCPKKTKDAKLEDCKAYVACRDLRRDLYKATNGLQIGCHTALSMYQLKDEKGAQTLLIQLGLKLAQLKALLQKHDIVPGGTKAKPATKPVAKPEPKATEVKVVKPAEKPKAVVKPEVKPVVKPAVKLEGK